MSVFQLSIATKRIGDKKSKFIYKPTICPAHFMEIEKGPIKLSFFRSLTDIIGKTVNPIKDYSSSSFFSFG